jgi:ATP/maltotriose-dependent transcriptional regulator MalT
MARGDTAGIDPAAVRSEVERAFAAMEDVRRVKSQLTQATTYIGEATKIVDTLATNVRGHLGQIDALLRPAEDDADVEAR